MQKLRASIDHFTSELVAWTVEVDVYTVMLSAAGAAIVWVTLKAVGGIIEEYARRIWFGSH